MTGKQRLHQLRQVLDSEFKRIDQVDPSELQLRADLSRYLCVRVSGFLERATAEVALHYCREKADQRVGRYVKKRLANFTNPTNDRLLNLVGAFDATWRQGLEDFIGQAGRKEAIGSVVALRHRIAHGDDVTTSYVQVSEYYAKVAEVVEFLAGVFDPV